MPSPLSITGTVGIAAGPDGNLWFTETGASKIGRMTTSGIVTEFSLPIHDDPGTGGPSTSLPAGITAGPDGNLWFTEGQAVGRITPSGSVTEFPVPAGLVAGSPTGIVAGPDGNLWFTEPNAGNTQNISHVGRITPSGTITEFPVPTLNSGPIGITAGPDGNLWFTESLVDKIGRITPSGIVTEFLVPTVSNPSSTQLAVIYIGGAGSQSSCTQSQGADDLLSNEGPRWLQPYLGSFQNVDHDPYYFSYSGTWEDLQ
jgi:virginiamycin B lyase